MVKESQMEKRLPVTSTKAIQAGGDRAGNFVDA